VRINGVPDSPAPGQFNWEQVSGSQGGMSIVNSFVADTPLTIGSYYLDDSTPAETQCTGDGSAYGASGLRVTSSIPNTDPRLGSAAHVTGTRHLYFGPPAIAPDAAANHAQRIATPLKVGVASR
jgi:hypothetical protein